MRGVGKRMVPVGITGDSSPLSCALLCGEFPVPARAREPHACMHDPHAFDPRLEMKGGAHSDVSALCVTYSSMTSKQCSHVCDYIVEAP